MGGKSLIMLWSWNNCVQLVVGNTNGILYYFKRKKSLLYFEFVYRLREPKVFKFTCSIFLTLRLIFKIFVIVTMNAVISIFTHFWNSVLAFLNSWRNISTKGFLRLERCVHNVSMVSERPQCLVVRWVIWFTITTGWKVQILACYWK